MVVFHDFDARCGSILDLFRISEETAFEARYIAQQIAEDLLRDIKVLREDLDAIERFAERELERPRPKE